MPRIPRIVVENCPHHVIQRGNRRQNVFFCDEDKKLYLKLLREQSKLYGVELWAYCLMDNHVHLIAVPKQPDSLAKAIGQTHRRYTWIINDRENWRGYLWQGRFSSFPLSEAYLYSALRYVERNPVRAGIVQRAEDYRWSSARAHVRKEEDVLLSDFYYNHEIKNWREYLDGPDKNEEIEIFYKHISTGKPLGINGDTYR